MFAIGLVSFFVCIAKGNEAGRGYFTKDPVAQTMWYIGTIPSLSTFFSSFIVYGFSYIVEAACMYIDKRNQDINEEIEQESTEE